MRARRLGLLAALLALGLATAWACRAPMLERMARTLVAATAPAQADVIAVLRGDEVAFERAQAGARLLHAGHASRIYVSSALDDLAAATLRSRGLDVPSSQRRVVGVLRQLGVSCDAIIVDRAQPGGGTQGELARIARMMETRGFHSVLLVTNWYHTRRSGLIAQALFAPAGLQVSVVQAEANAPISGWWHQRYLAITVWEETLKLLLQRGLGAIGFADDPRTAPGVILPALASGCEVAARLGVSVHA